METREERTKRIREISLEGYNELLQEYYDKMRIFSCRK